MSATTASRRLLTRLTLFFGLCLPAAHAQADATALNHATGSVSGRVLSADTHLPLRRASVRMITTNAKSSGAADAATKDVSATVQTGANGDFSFLHLPPGDYYLVSTMQGYVPLQNLIQHHAEPDAPVADLIAQIPQVHVTAGQESRRDLFLSTGATISGSVLYQDGAPVVGVLVKLDWDGAYNDPRLLGLLPLGLASRLMVAFTDDRGRFRFPGVPPGRFLIEAHLPINEGVRDLAPGGTLADTRQPLILFAPSAIKPAQAQRIQVKEREVIQNVDVTVVLDGLYSISGRLLAQTDGHPINRATLRLTTSADPSFSRQTRVAGDGSYSLDFLPPGTYHLELSSAADSEEVESADADAPSKIRLLHHYLPQSLHLTILNANLVDRDLHCTEDKTQKPGELLDPD